MSSTNPSESTPVVNMGEAAVEYAMAGLRVFPVWGINPRDGSCQCGTVECPQAGKHPVGHLAPNGLNDASEDVDVVSKWWRSLPNANVGIATGRDLVVLDADVKVVDGKKVDGRVYLEMLLRAGGREVKPTAIALTGAGGEHWYFKKPEDVRVGNRQHLKLTTGEKLEGLDVRGDGGYVVAPPSLHKSGSRYRWTTEFSSMLEIPPRILDELARPEPMSTTHTVTARDVSGSEVLRICDALSAISPNCSREDWLMKVGMPLHDHFGGSDEGFDLWDQWSSNAGHPVYPGRDKCLAQWRSLKSQTMNPRGINTLWHYARSLGWRPDDDVVPMAPIRSIKGHTAIPSENVTQFSPEEIAEAMRTEESSDLPVDVWQDLKGPIREMHRWALDCNFRPDPVIAMGSALAMVCASIGRRIIGPTGSSASTAIAVLAPSGAGKDKAQECVKNYLRRFPGLITPVLEDSPFHRVQLDDKMMDGKGQAILLLDEYGSRLKGWLDVRKVGDTMSAAIRQYIGAGRHSVQLFPASEGNQTVKKHGAEAWNAGIFAPALSLFGFSTPAQFYDALSVGSLSDGFLGRHVILETRLDRVTDLTLADRSDTTEPPPMVSEFARSMQSIPIPMTDPFLARCLKVNGQPIGTQIAGQTEVTPRDPIRLPFGEGAEDLFMAVVKECDSIANKKLRFGSDVEAAIYRRLPGQVSTLSLLFAVGESDDPRHAAVDRRHIQTGYDIASWAAAKLVHRLDGGAVSKMAFEDAYQSMCAGIAKAGGDKVYRSKLGSQRRYVAHMRNLWQAIQNDPRFEVSDRWARVRDPLEA